MFSKFQRGNYIDQGFVGQSQDVFVEFGCLGVPGERSNEIEQITLQLDLDISSHQLPLQLFSPKTLSSQFKPMDFIFKYPDAFFHGEHAEEPGVEVGSVLDNVCSVDPEVWMCFQLGQEGIGD